MAGRWFEKFTQGMVIDHAITRTITEWDNMFFCALTHNSHPLHINRHFAEQTEFGKPLVSFLHDARNHKGVLVASCRRPALLHHRPTA